MSVATRRLHMKARLVVSILFTLLFVFRVSSLAQSSDVVVAPSDLFTITYKTYPTLITNSLGMVYSNRPDPLAYAIAIFDVPTEATNREAFIEFSTLNSNPRVRQEIFAFAGPGGVITNIVDMPTSFIDAIETNNAAGRRHIDVTPWARQFAGKRFGIQIRPGIEGRGRMDFSDFKLYLIDPENRDAAPHLALVPPAPARILDTKRVSLSVTISDTDGGLSSWQMLDNATVVASEVFEPALGAGAIQRTVTLTNVGRGGHLFAFRAFSGTNGASAEATLSYVREPDDWPHRWLGSFGNSGSFYVVDAAGRAHVWGRNESAQLGLGFLSDYVKRPVTLVPPEGVRFRQIASNTNAARALTDQSTVYLWGLQYYSRPILSDMGPATRIAMTDELHLSLMLSGNLEGEAFGTSNQKFNDLKAGADVYYARLQNGALRSVPIPTNALPVVDYAESRPLSYAIGTDAKMYAWGPTTQGTVNEVRAPGVTGWRRVVASSALTVSIDEIGRLWEWGRGFDAKQTDTVAHLVPFTKSITNWLDIAVTSEIAMALSAEGELYAWGRGVQGAWNDPVASVATRPELVTGLPDLLNPNATRTVTSFMPVTLSGGYVTLTVAVPTNVVPKIEVSSDLVNWRSYTNATSRPRSAPSVLVPVVEESKFFRVAP